LNWYRLGPSAARAVLEGFLVEQQAAGRIRQEADPARAATLFHDMISFDLLNRAMMGIDGSPGPQDVTATIRDAVVMTTLGILRQSPEAGPTWHG
jgi:hypothetical protein